ncbi:diguanylate cyclase/phosphodiesterase (GGDEF & EAL domains) with PAS/PAC sensor(s) [Olavius sp. associated proteobacterium Delta 1]|nr:diguanylate cyclase/phosphodiesterase (GGDEF & EAL domains) with PAS/PAC sensor(s) [Olavius sp. associated proteobacterium Delta 1]
MNISSTLTSTGLKKVNPCLENQKARMFTIRFNEENRMWKLRIYLSVIVVFLCLSATLSATTTDELKIVYSVGVAPLKFEDAASRPAGLLPDWWRLWAQNAGRKIKFVRAESFKESLQLLKDGKVDLHGGLFKTPQREKFLDYSKPLLALDYYIFTHPSVYPIKSLEKTAGFLVGIQQGGYTEQLVRSKVPANRIVVYDRFQDLFRAALEGEVKVFVATELSLLYFLKENFQTNIFENNRDRPLFSQVYYTAANKGNPALIQQVNDGIKAIGSAERKQLENKWIEREFKDIPKASKVALPEKEMIALTDAERQWLATHKKIVVGGEMDWAPFDFVDATGQYAGVANDYLKVIGENLGIEVQIVTGPSWDELLTLIRSKEIDVLPAIYHSREREAFVNFTDPYLKLTEFIFTRSDNQNITSMVGLQDKTIVVVKGYTIEAELRSNYPAYDLITAPTIQDALKKLVVGEADAFIGDIISTSYNIKELSLVGIRPAATVPFRGPSVHMAVRKDWPVLGNLIDKALQAIPESQHDAIRNQWISFAEKKIEQSRPEIALTAEEQVWVKQHPVIRVHNEKNWPPFNYFEYGRPRGLSIDYMDLMAEKLGIEVEYVTGPSWNEFLAMVKRKELDVMLNIVKTEDRQKYLLYTEPYVKNPNVVVSYQKNAYESIEALFGKIVAFPKGFFYEEVLTKSFPRINRLPVEDTLASLKAVVFGKADAALGEAAVIRTLINKNMLSGLQVSGEVKLGNPDLTNLRLGVRDDWPLLQSALMKAMAEVTVQEMNQIRQKWLAVDKRQFDGSDVSLSDASAGKLAIPLAAEESTWLAARKKIRFTGDPDWLPQEAFTSQGQYVGIVADILDLLEARLGIVFERVPVKTWDEAVRLAEAAEVDVLSETTSSERATMTFTEPYLLFPVVIIAKQGTQPVSGPGELKGKRVAVVKGYGYVIPFRRQYPDLDYVVVDTVRDGLLRLSAKQVDAFISAAPTAAYLMSELGLTNLNVIGSTGLSIDLGFGVRKDTPVLVSILNKALASITEEEKLIIRQKWVPVIDTPVPQTADPISYGRLIGYGIAVFLILSLLTWVLIKVAKKEQLAVSFGSRWFRGLVLAGLSFFVIVVCLLGWFTLDKNKEQILAGVGEDLTETLINADDRLSFWVEKRISSLKLLGRDPELVTLVKRLLAVKSDRENLLASDALRDARAFFKNNKDVFSNIGFFIINADHISIGSMRDTNIGTPNLISLQRPELLRRAFAGEVLFVPPIESDVPLEKEPQAEGARNPSTKFFMGPIRDPSGQSIAVMTLRVDPSQEFSQLLPPSITHKTGETYAFSEHGEMLSESRFGDLLRRIGLIGEDQQSALNVAIRNPGVNLVAGQRPQIERSQQPLTRMASGAIQLKAEMTESGHTHGHSKIEIDTKGYRDYRGVPVFGAWLWNAGLGLGLATEIDVTEAMSDYYQIRRTVLGVLGVTLFLSVSAVLLVLILGERTSHALMKARDNLETKVDERTAELQEKQAQLEEALERSGLLLDSAGEGIFGVDLDGKVAFINPAANRMLGFESDDLIGQEVHEKIHHSHADGTGYPKAKCPMYMTHVDGTDHYVTDEVLWRKDGTPFPVEYTSMPIKKADRVVGAVVTFMDITERKKIETALLAERERLQKILDTSPVGVGISTEGVVRFANPRFAELFDRKEGEAAQEAYVNPQDRDHIVSELKSSGIVRDYELQTYGRNREIRDTLATFISTEYEGQTGILSWMVDLGGLKEAERELKAKFDELARFRRLAIGREQKMIELKKEINELMKTCGMSEKYKIH